MIAASPASADDARRAALAEAAGEELSRRNLLDFCQRMDASYERAPHVELLAEKLEALERRDIRRLIVAMPPRHGKSRMCSQLFPAWLLGRHPDQSIILASYASELAEQNSRRVRELVVDDRFPFIDVKVNPESRAVGRWATTAGALCIAAGVTSGLSGFGGSLILDDPIADRASAESPAIRESTSAWYQDVARTRLHSGAFQLVISTRWHEDDPVGRILNSAMASEWEVLNLPAIAEDKDALGRVPGEALWPERFPISELPSVERGEISSRSFAALYQQRPVPAEGHIFHSSWFENRYNELPPLRIIATAADCAAKTGVSNDFSAIVTVGTDGVNFFIINALAERLEFAALAHRMVDVCNQFSPHRVYIEDASSGTPLTQELRRATSLPIIGVPPRGTKIARAEAVSGLFEAGKVRLPKDAPWVDSFIEEFLHFPAGKHDDRVDATSLVMSKLRALVAYPEFSFAFAHQ